VVVVVELSFVSVVRERSKVELGEKLSPSPRNFTSRKFQREKFHQHQKISWSTKAWTELLERKKKSLACASASGGGDRKLELKPWRRRRSYYYCQYDFM